VLAVPFIILPTLSGAGQYSGKPRQQKVFAFNNESAFFRKSYSVRGH